MKSLPPSIKFALTLQNPVPSPPSRAALFYTFSTTLKHSSAHKAEREWLSITTAALLAYNSPLSIAHLYHYITNPHVSKFPASSTSSSTKNYNDASATPEDLTQRIGKASLMRETALKCSVFVGVPRVINTLAALTSALEDDVKEALQKNSDPADAHPASIKTRGKALFSHIYDPHTEKLLQKLHSYHPDFPTSILNSYGSILARYKPGDPGAVGRSLTSAIGVACLRAERGVGPQLTSHVFGLFKAREGRLEQEGEDSEGARWITTEAGVQWILDTVDSLGEAVQQGEEKPKL